MIGGIGAHDVRDGDHDLGAVGGVEREAVARVLGVECADLLRDRFELLVQGGFVLAVRCEQRRVLGRLLAALELELTQRETIVLQLGVHAPDRVLFEIAPYGGALEHRVVLGLEPRPSLGRTTRDVLVADAERFRHAVETAPRAPLDDHRPLRLRFTRHVEIVEPGVVRARDVEVAAAHHAAARRTFFREHFAHGRCALRRQALEHVRTGRVAFRHADLAHDGLAVHGLEARDIRRPEGRAAFLHDQGQEADDHRDRDRERAAGQPHVRFAVSLQSSRTPRQAPALLDRFPRACGAAFSHGGVHNW